MIPQADLTAEQPSALSLSSITSSITRSLSHSSITSALAGQALSAIVPFDRCCLLVSQENAEETNPSWRAFVADKGSQETSTKYFRASQTAFASLLSEGATALVLGASDLYDAVDVVGSDARAALALPLSTDGRAFGALCYVSSSEGAYDETDIAALLWMRDVAAAATSAALYRERLEMALEARHELERLKGGFVNTLVREIRVPLTNVLGLLELFETKLQMREPFDLEDRQLLTGAIEQGARMRHLVDDLLEVTRQQERELQLSLEHADPAEILEEAVEPLRGEAALRGIELNVRVGMGTPDFHVDVRQTRRAICHLLSVALGATPAGGRINVEAQAITGTRVGDEGRRFVIININDSGEGIPPEEVPYVFDAFWHASLPNRSAVRGLNLAIAKRVAAAHGGSVAVRSQLGAGTTYSIVLPARNLDQKHAHGQSILVVDDAPELLLLLGKLIERMGYRVWTASNAARALELLGEHEIDLLITDWAMPEANGGDLIASLKGHDRWRKLPTVVITGHDTAIERRDALAAGCDRFLVKPVMRDELQRVITEMLPQSVA